MKILKIDHLYESDLHRDVPCNNPLIPPVLKKNATWRFTVFKESLSEKRKQYMNTKQVSNQGTVLIAYLC